VAKPGTCGTESCGHDPTLQLCFDQSWKPGDGALRDDQKERHAVMKASHRHNLVAAALAGALTLTSAHAQTHDTVEAEIGTLTSGSFLGLTPDV
jgi:hypothetical protein